MYRRLGNVRIISQILHHCICESPYAHTLKQRHLKGIRHFSYSKVYLYSAPPHTDLSTRFADLEAQRVQLVLDLQNIFKNQSMSPKLKAKRLKITLFQLISILPNSEFTRKQLPMANSIINYIDQNPDPSDTFTSDEILALLRSVLGAMTIEDVRYIDFFPRFYNSMRKTKEYDSDLEIRLQLFEIFLNYVFLSNKRESVVKIIQAFIEEEENVHKTCTNDQVVAITLEAFKTIKPDTETMINLWRLVTTEGIRSPALLEQMLETFFRAADEEISQAFEDNFVSERLVLLLNELEKKIPNPIEAYVELLYFATKNSFEQVSLEILNKLEKISNNFQLTQYKDVFVGDVLFALVGSALRYGKTKSAKNLIDLLKERDETVYNEEEWMVLLQWTAYKANEEKSAFEILLDLNKKLEKLEKDYAFEDVDSYNLVIEALCWSKKSFGYIEKFQCDFDNVYVFQPDAKSIVTIFDYLVSQNNIGEAANYFMKNKDKVDWESDYEGFYIFSLFRLTASVWEAKELPWDLKIDVYKNVKRYEYIYDKESVYRMLKASFDLGEPKFAILAFLDQTPDIKSGETKLDSKKYDKIFDCVYNFISTSKDGELNARVYKYITETFDISYDYFPGFVQMFINSNRPDMALKVFADMKALSKEKKLPPPSEEFYIYLFKALGRYQDDEGIFKLHLALKMDLSINLDIKLLNAVMEGYAALEDPFKTRDTFNMAFALPKEYGLNNESAYWMLKSLKYATLGHVKEFYNGLSDYEVLPDSNLFAEFLIANCYFEQYRTALDTLIDINEHGDPELINEHVLKTLHNNCLHDGVRKDLDEYASLKFPQAWQNLKATQQLQVNDDYPDLLDSPFGEPTIGVKRIGK